MQNVEPQILVSHYSSLRNICRDFAPIPEDASDVCGVWYYGPTGTGKSRAARHDFPSAYMKLPNKWWDGYQNEESVIIDDFDKNHEKLGYHLKIWADRYAFPAEIKGSTIRIRPKKLIVTSNYHPKEIWGESANTLEPILRRFKVVHFDELRVKPSTPAIPPPLSAM